MKCVLSWCHAEAALPVICAEHVWQWDESGEHLRATKCDGPREALVALHDWVRRVEAERLNHGNEVAHG
jgi:hypothetical protein